MKICPMGNEFFLTNRRTDMTKLIVALRPKNAYENYAAIGALHPTSDRVNSAGGDNAQTYVETLAR
jgi:hypothetical protein